LRPLPHHLNVDLISNIAPSRKLAGSPPTQATLRWGVKGGAGLDHLRAHARRCYQMFAAQDFGNFVARSTVLFGVSRLLLPAMDPYLGSSPSNRSGPDFSTQTSPPSLQQATLGKFCLDNTPPPRGKENAAVTVGSQ
jgi:hypothetical protein